MTFEDFCQIISELTHVPIEKTNEHALFRDDLGIDSLQMVNFLVQFSEKTGAGLEKLTAADDISSVGGLYRTIYKGVK